jgi:transposase, IS30 family
VATFVERKTRLYTAIQMPDRTALPMEITFGAASSQYSTAHSKRQPLTVAKSLLAMPIWKLFMMYKSILLIRIPPGNGALMKTRMACCESSSPKVQIWPKLQMKPCGKLST